MQELGEQKKEVLCTLNGLEKHKRGSWKRRARGPKIPGESHASVTSVTIIKRSVDNVVVEGKLKGGKGKKARVELA